MVLLPAATSSAPSVYPTYPPASLFSSTSKNPPTLSPPISDRTLAHPFTIGPVAYNAMLHVGWPITIALIYATSVRFFNQVNKERNYQPWPFSKSLTFYVLVVAHNVFLALYSGWTFAGMFNTIRRSWPGWNGEYGLAGVADALCKMHGPRGPGSAATYNTTSGSWGISDITMRLAGGTPDSTDVGRIWNEGLAFYGWLFYLSKFYEVVDTIIILSKGKKSSLLQTYHHAGAMFAMWAGIRYMSPPIWMFTLINSGLHTLMYTYYTLSALTIRVPPVLKRTLTFLQIAQIVFGGSYALAHLFVAYDVPHYASYRVLNNLSTAIPSAASSLSSAVASATASANIGSWLKKAALRAAGEEGLAENVRNHQGETFGIDAIHAADVQKAQEEISYHLEMTRTHCLDTPGEVFAILLNALYLAPLAYMFITFFARYFQARADGDPKPSVPENAMKSANDGAKEVERKIAEAMEDKQGGETEPPAEVKAELEEAKHRVKTAASDAKQISSEVSGKVQNDIKDIRAKAQQAASHAKDKVKDSAPEIQSEARQRAEDLNSKAQDVAQHANEYAKDRAQAIKEIANQKAGQAKDQASKVANSSAKISKEGINRLIGKRDATAGDVEGKEGNEKAENANKEEEKSHGEEGGEKDDEMNDEMDDEMDDEMGDEMDDEMDDKMDNEKDDKKGEKKDDKKDDEKGGEEGDGAGDASAYEVNPDLPKTEDEKKAEEEMQPDGK
ncbi:MAG: hypothetical protein Q9217_001413 [Psora testacea]